MSDKLLYAMRDGEESQERSHMEFHCIRHEQERRRSAMKIRHILIAGAALAVGPAIAQDAAPEASGDCASLQSQLDAAASTASAQQMSAAQAARDEGKRLCSEGKTEEGAAKLQEAISTLSQPSQQPPAGQPTMEESPTHTQQPPTDTQGPPTNIEQPPR
jgi:hypothetical protein